VKAEDWEYFAISEGSVYRYREIIGMIGAIEHDLERKGCTFTNGDGIRKLSLAANELLALSISPRDP
jgi:hypothetical protein